MGFFTRRVSFGPCLGLSRCLCLNVFLTLSLHSTHTHSHTHTHFQTVSCVTFLNPDDIKPRIEEINLFKERKTKGDEEEDEEDDEVKERKTMVEELLALLPDDDEDASAAAVPFVPGDFVQVTSGDLRGMIGKIVKIDPTSRLADMEPLNFGADGERLDEGLRAKSISVESNVLVKYVAAGYHVKVVAGRYSGTTGRVMAVTTKDRQWVAAVLTDGVNTEIEVNVASLQMSSEVATGYGSLGGYELYDLVSLNVNETAMIINVGSERLRIINHMDLVKEVLPQELQKNRNRQSSRSTGFDAQQSTVAVGDLVEVRSGAHIKKKGTVKAIMNGCFWLHSTNHLKHSGVFVIRGRHCVLSGKKVSSLTGTTLTSLGSKAAASASMPNNKAARDPTIGKTVKIIKGGFKGFLAQVVDANATQYTVELLARVKKIVIEKVKCKVVGDQDGSFKLPDEIDHRGFHSANNQFVGLAGASTPFLGGETPMMGGETPMASAERRIVPALPGS